MDQTQFEAILADAEVRVRRLRHLYDMWFQGIERREPADRRREFELLLTTMRREPPRNTALRFRFDQLVMRYHTYTTYWQRVARQIEEGTYKRDLARAQRLRDDDAEAEPTRPREAYELDAEGDAGADGAGQRKPISPFAQPEAPRPARPGAAGAGQGLSDEQIRQIYERYVAARAKNSERVDNVNFENIAKSVRNMLPKLAEKHAGKEIDFKVVVKDGRVALKPVPK
jgi:hypothetical protein